MQPSRSFYAPLLAAALLAAGATLTTATSTEDAELPLIASVGGEGAGWVTLAFDTPGDPVEISITGTGVQWPAIASLSLRNASFTHSSSTGTGYVGTKTGAHVDAGLPDESRVQFSTMETEGGTEELRASRTLGADGDRTRQGVYYAILYTAGNVDSWRVEVRSTGDVDILDVKTGDEAFLYTTEDFNGGSIVSAYAPVASDGARVVHDVELRLTVENQLVGYFSSAFANVDVLRVQTPIDERECPCGFSPFHAYAATGPGDYVFRADGAGVGPNGWTDIKVAGADVRMPDLFWT